MKMNNIFIKNFILSICIGIGIGIIYDGVRPNYKYYTQKDGLEITKEVYLELSKDEKNYQQRKLFKVKQTNNYALALGTLSFLVLFLINPYPIKKENT